MAIRTSVGRKETLSLTEKDNKTGKYVGFSPPWGSGKMPTSLGNDFLAYKAWPT